MKILQIADVHGRDTWKEQVKVDFDHCIFTGDYLDSWDIDGDTQLKNFREIIEFKRENPDRVTLLVGNHDLSYMDVFCQCSGYQNDKAYIFKIVLDELYQNKEIQACKIIKDHIFIHAGITKTWMKDYEIDNDENLETTINDLFYTHLDAFCFQAPPRGFMTLYSGYGDNVWQSPCWVRPQSLARDKIDGYVQVVGHTQVEKPVFIDGIWLTDCQEKTKDHFILEL